MSIEPGTATPIDIQKCQRALQEAVVQDFLDDFPDPTHPADVAKRLYLSQAVVRYHVTTGDLVGTFQDGRWHIDVQASRDWIASSLSRRASRRLALQEAAQGPRPITVSISEPGALRQLQDLQASGLTLSDVVEYALQSLSSLRADDYAPVT
ncbi:MULTISPECIES: hypothetical protein [Plantibacter]|uniref:hypothetical protein n=1 Tax=Plantibacter TaxID=190323 RepID=UPI0010C174D8|nr:MULTISPECIES: hypothetical protein [Plantibacter]MBD8103829.1 hypothetical protein [Plantibacter sp. CFBP 8775]MBD8467276.1 hypothetical protein [Plantibacter sp. CFBP 8798]